MANGWIEPEACRNLAVLIESVTAPMLIEHQSPVCLELDVDMDLPIPCEKRLCAELVQSLCRQALTAMSDGGDLVITACETASGLDLEIADSGTDLESRERRLPFAAAAADAALDWQSCPQGGVAVTIRFPRQQSSGRLAA
ncbi:MAG: ATPase [Planctomycetota bacterium]